MMLTEFPCMASALASARFNMVTGRRYSVVTTKQTAMQSSRVELNLQISRNPQRFRYSAVESNQLDSLVGSVGSPCGIQITNPSRARVSSTR